MVELLRSNDLVLISYVRALLAESGIDSLLLDQHTSAMEGSIGAIPRRVMIAAEDCDLAERRLREAGIARHGF